MDPYVLLALITSASSLMVSVLTHIKHSKCWNCEIETRDTQQSEERRTLIPSQPEIQDEIYSKSRSNSRVTFCEDKNSYTQT